MTARMPLVGGAIVLAALAALSHPTRGDTRTAAETTRLHAPEGGAAAMFEYRVFEEWEGSDSIWGDLCVARDGRVYVGVSNHLAEGGNAALYQYDPDADRLRVVADIAQVIGQHPGTRGVAQGKIHTRVAEGQDGRIYGGTMMGGHYTHRVATYDYPRSYPGGHLWVYDPQSGKTSNLGIPVAREAIYSVAPDTERGKVYGITFHHRLFFIYDLASGSVDIKGTVGVGEDVYVDKGGTVYTNGPWGNVVRYDPEIGELVDLPIFFPRNPDGTPGTNGPNMADLGSDGGIYSITYWGRIFKFDPHAGEYGRIHSLGFVLGDGTERVYTPNLTLSKDEGTLYYLAGCHGAYLTEDRSGVHFVEMDAATGKRTDHGLVVTEPQVTGCFAAGTGPDGTVYFGAQCWGEISWHGQQQPPGAPLLMIYRPTQP